MNNLPTPLTPADCDLTKYPFMPLAVQRLLTSETWILGTGDERAAAITLWLESWHQIPSGSLPDNDRMLAHLSQARNWKKVKAHALRGWITCSDGRLYHPVVAEKALEGWIDKLVSGLSGAKGNAVRWHIEVDVKSTEAKIVEAVNLLQAIAPRSETLLKKQVKHIVEESQGESHRDKKTIAPRSEDVSPPDSGCDRNREGEGEGKNKDIVETSQKTVATDILDYLNDKTGRAYKPVEANLRVIAARLRESSLDECRAVIDAKCGEWLQDEKMCQYLRPETLFGATKFAQYVGQLGNSGGGADPFT